MSAKRPGGVTLVAILAWISGLFDVVTGILMLTTDVFVESDNVTAVIFIVIGAVVIIVAAGLLRGNSVARIIVTALQVFSLAAAGTYLIMSGASVVTNLISILISVIVLMLLWSKRANAFFGS